MVEEYIRDPGEGALPGKEEGDGTKREVKGGI